jgi:hypothetical protein
MERVACVGVRVALPVVLTIGVTTAHGDPRHGSTGGATAAATAVQAQVGAAIGGGSFTGPYDPDFRALVVTGYGGALFGHHVGVGVRAMYLHGGETDDGGLFPEYEQTRVPILVTGRLQSRYVFAELGVARRRSGTSTGRGSRSAARARRRSRSRWGCRPPTRPCAITPS